MAIFQQHRISYFQPPGLNPIQNNGYNTQRNALPPILVRRNWLYRMERSTAHALLGVEGEIMPNLDTKKIWIALAVLIIAGGGIASFMLGLIDNWTKPGCGGRAETEYQEVQ